MEGVLQCGKGEANLLAESFDKRDHDLEDGIRIKW
jgi:hypothetical protein